MNDIVTTQEQVALKRMRPLRQTVDTVKEDVEWARQKLTCDAK